MHEISNNVVCALENSMIVELLTEHHLECPILKGGCRGSTESTHVKMSHCWKSHALAQLCAPGSLSYGSPSFAFNVRTSFTKMLSSLIFVIDGIRLYFCFEFCFVFVHIKVLTQSYF